MRYFAKFTFLGVRRWGTCAIHIVWQDFNPHKNVQWIPLAGAGSIYWIYAGYTGQDRRTGVRQEDWAQTRRTGLNTKVIPVRCCAFRPGLDLGGIRWRTQLTVG